MSRKSALVAVLASVLIFGVAALPAYAGHGKKAGYHCGSKKDKVYRKACMLLKNREELGLSDKQVDKIKALKYDAKKAAIRRQAEIDIIAVDLRKEKHADTLNIEAVNKLIDKKYELKKEKAKASVKACAEIKGTLTEEQKAKLKEIWKKCKKWKMGSVKQR